MKLTYLYSEYRKVFDYDKTIAYTLRNDYSRKNNITKHEYSFLTTMWFIDNKITKYDYDFTSLDWLVGELSK